MDASNRYFTSTREAPMDTHIPFEREIDPDGVLAGLVTSTYIHSECNVVEYLERIQVPESEKIRHVTRCRDTRQADCNDL